MLLEKTRFTVNDELDFVEVKLNVIDVRIGYRIGFVIAKSLRIASQQAARFHRAPPRSLQEIDLPDDLDDCPAANQFPRQSTLAPTVSSYEVGVNPPLVFLQFDAMVEEMDYETAIKLAHAIRRASRRAKAWAGDSTSYSSLMGNLTDAEDDYRLGIA